MAEFALFILGVVVGGFMSLFICLYMLNKWAKDYESSVKLRKKGAPDDALLDGANSALKGLEDAVKDLEMMGSIKERFNKVDEMIQEQLSLMSAIDGPSRGASHSKYKGEIARRIKELEENKLAVYKTILADGIDPTLTAIVDGDASKMKLSDAVREMELALADVDGPKPKTNSKEPRKNFLKLVTEEATDESENPTIS